MIPLRVNLIAVPATVWQGFPKARPLAELAKDAAGATRRIRKQTNARQEIVRFTQLCTYIETVALELLRRTREKRPPDKPNPVRLRGIRSVEWSDGLANGNPATAYVRLVEGLRAHHGSREPSPEGESGRANAIGQTIFPPGADVSEQRRIFEALYVPVLERIFPELPDSARTTLALLAAQKAALYRAAEASGSAVVEVVSQQSA